MNTEQTKSLRQRKSYVVGRIPELKAEMAKLREEKKTDAGKEPGDEKAAQKLRQRRVYVTTRIRVLSGEQKDLVEEKKDIDAKLKKVEK